LHVQLPQVHVPAPLQGAAVVVGHAAVEHAQVGPDQPLAHAHSPVAQSQPPPLAHALAQPWQVAQSAAPFTVVP